MGAYATGLPLFPPGYVAGTINLAVANTVYNLLALIQTQLDVNCPGAGQQVTLTCDGGAGAVGIIYVGRASPIGGALTTTNYGYVLAPGSSQTYRSSFPGNNSPVGNLQVLADTNNTKLHVEVSG